MADTIYKDHDFYVPAFDVKVKNRSLEQAVVRDILQVSYQDSLDAIDSFDITINNWDAEKRTFKYSDTDRFVPGNEVELWMGYYGKSPLKLMIKGVIKSLAPTFPASGQPTLKITGQNQLDKLRRKQVSDTYKDMTDSQIAKRIAGRLGVGIRTDPEAENAEEAHSHLFQAKQYDILFLLERAKRIGYELAADTNDVSKLYFGPSRNVRKEIYHLTYGKSLIQFQPHLETSNQVGKVKVQSWDAEKGEKIETTVNRSAIKTRGLNDTAFQKALEASFKDKEEVINKPVNSLQEAQTLGLETLERIAKKMLTGSGSTVGLPDLRAGTVLMIDGLDQSFSGLYFVTATTHSIGDSGYTTEFQCRRE